jgi:hypothetical protein
MDLLMKQRRMSPLERFGRLFFAFWLLMAGPVCGLVSYMKFQEARATRTWPSVWGMIVVSHVAIDDEKHYYPDVEYEYSVGDRELTGTRIAYSKPIYDSPEGAANYVEELAPGKAVRVYCDPNDPSHSVLEPGAGYQERAMLVISVVTFLMGLGVVYWMWRDRS